MFHIHAKYHCLVQGSELTEQLCQVLYQRMGAVRQANFALKIGGVILLAHFGVFWHNHFGALFQYSVLMQESR